MVVGGSVRLLRGWSEKFSVSTIDGNNIDKRRL